MHNRNEKKRDMIRSVLPSTRRNHARYAKSAANRGNRRKVHMALHSYDTQPLFEDWIDYADNAIHGAIMFDESADRRMANADSKYESSVKCAMWDRREGDKLGPIFRWAKAQVADIPQEDRISYVGKMLNDTPMGRHAMSHIEFLEEFDDGRRYRWWRSPEERERDRFLYECRWAELKYKIRWMIREGHAIELAHLTSRNFQWYSTSWMPDRFWKDFLCQFEEDIDEFLSRSWTRMEAMSLDAALTALFKKYKPLS